MSAAPAKKKPRPNTRAATEGEWIDIVTRVPVRGACGGGEVGGRWYCATHKESFPNNLMKGVHTEKGKHVLVWICIHHGPEVP